METGAITQDEIADLLDRLVAKSLVVFDEATSRYHAYEMVRQYGRETLVADLEHGGVNVRERHAIYFRDFVNALPVGTSIDPRLVEPDYENIRAAVEWWIGQPNRSDALQMVAALRPFWAARSMLREGFETTSKAVEQYKGAENASYVAGLCTRANTGVFLGRIEEGRAELELALTRARAIGDPQLISLALSYLAGFHQDYIADYEKSRAYRLEVLELAKSMNLPQDVSRHHYNLGDLMLISHPDVDDPVLGPNVWKEAESHFVASLENADPRMVFFVHTGLGRVAMYRGDFPTAQDHFLQCLRGAIDLGRPLGESLTCALLATLANKQSRYKLSAMLVAKAMFIANEINFVPGEADAAEFYRIDADNKSRLSEEEIESCRQRAAGMTASDFIDLISKELS